MTKNKETLLTQIKEELRATVPINAEAPAENITIPGDVEEVFLIHISIPCLLLLLLSSLLLLLLLFLEL